jgi:hypothetical protein
VSTILNDARLAVLALCCAYLAVIALLGLAIWVLGRTDDRKDVRKKVMEVRQQSRDEALSDAQWQIFVRDHGLVKADGGQR